MSKYYLIKTDKPPLKCGRNKNSTDYTFNIDCVVGLTEEELEILIKSLNNLDYYEQRDCESWSDCKDGSSGLAKTEYQKIHNKIVNVLPKVRKVLDNER